MSYYTIVDTFHFINVTTTMRGTVVCDTREEIPNRIANVLEIVGTDTILYAGDVAVCMEHVSGVSFYITHREDGKSESEPLSLPDSNRLMREAYRIMQARAEKSSSED
ncbi:MAG: hypothetical protein NC489_08460 [Ruminococcus flavefaciens]|nr:hypothetical protein [Ruminococcus flavefaciens]